MRYKDKEIENLGRGEQKKEETKVVILDDNPISIARYAEEYPENWKKICEALDENKN